MQEIYWAILLSVGVCLVSGPFLIPFLRHIKFGQHIRSCGPTTHLKKAGNPTMGGLMFVLSLSIGTLLLRGASPELVTILLVTFGFGIIGFFDDFIKVVMKRPLGLKAREKIFGQILISGCFAYVAVTYLNRGTEISIPTTSFVFDLGLWYIPFAVFILVWINNAVNITDGLDGLAAGVTLFASLAFLLITKAWGLTDLSIFSAALLGSCLGFLFFNIHPAKIFMGDVGSLILGGAIGSLAILTKTELLLPILGGVYLLETLSVVIQITYFKISGGKRIFKMSPLHHHFELSGWSEQKVVLVFWTMAAIFASIAVSIIL